MNQIGQLHEELLHDLNLLQEEGYESESSTQSEFHVVDEVEEDSSSSVFTLFESASKSLLKSTRDASITITNASNLYKASEANNNPMKDVEEHVEVEIREMKAKITWKMQRKTLWMN